MIVTTSAVHRHSQHPAAERRQHIVEVVITPVRSVLLAVVDSRPSTEKSGSNARFVGRVVELVASDLLTEELVVGLVLVKSVNYIVAIPPGVGTPVVHFEAGRVSIPRDIQPVPTPPHAILW